MRRFLPGSDEHNEPNWLSCHLITLLVMDTLLEFWSSGLLIVLQLSISNLNQFLRTHADDLRIYLAIIPYMSRLGLGLYIYTHRPFMYLFRAITTFPKQPSYASIQSSLYTSKSPNLERPTRLRRCHKSSNIGYQAMVSRDILCWAISSISLDHQRLSDPILTR